MSECFAAAASHGDYVEANKYMDELPGLLNEYQTASHSFNNRVAQKDYESRMPKILDEMKKVGKPEKDVDSADVLAAYEQVLGEKTAAEAAAKQNDYLEALKHAKSLADKWETYNAALSKARKPVDWLTNRVQKLHAKINTLYFGAAAKLDDHADSFDRALKAHETALKNAKAELMRSLEPGFLETLFWVALAGFGGGAVAQLLKPAKSLEKSFRVLATAGGIDASKDVVKQVIKMGGALRNSSVTRADPLKEIKANVSNGSELARGLGARLKREAELLMKEVESILDLLEGYLHGKRDLNLKELGLDSDPSETLDKSQFFKIMDGLPEPNERSYAKAIWAGWIEEQAYPLKRLVVIPDLLPDRPKYTIDDDLIDMPSLQQEIIKQAGSAILAWRAIFAGPVQQPNAQNRFMTNFEKTVRSSFNAKVEQSYLKFSPIESLKIKMCLGGHVLVAEGVGPEPKPDVQNAVTPSGSFGAAIVAVIISLMRAHAIRSNLLVKQQLSGCFKLGDSLC